LASLSNGSPRDVELLITNHTNNKRGVSVNIQALIRQFKWIDVEFTIRSMYTLLLIVFSGLNAFRCPLDENAKRRSRSFDVAVIW
jgi:hypothetical protein